MYAISFDFKSTEAFTELNPKRRCYFYEEIRDVLEKNSFVHRQGSVYVSKRGLSYVHKAIEALKNLSFSNFFGDIWVFKHEPDCDFTDIVTS